MDAMPRLQLARALALSRDTVKAKSAYNDLFALGKNADSEIRVVNEARARQPVTTVDSSRLGSGDQDDSRQLKTRRTHPVE